MLINIISQVWDEVPNEIILKSFELTGIYSEKNKHFMSYQLEIKRKLILA